VTGPLDVTRPSSASREPSVCAVLLGEDDALQVATRAQARPPRSVICAASAADGVRRALEQHTEWIWLLDGSALPSPDTLARLLDGLKALGDNVPALLASKILACDGTLALGMVPWPRRGQIEQAMFAFERHSVPIRATPGASLLVSTAVAQEHSPPADRLASGLAILGWTARMLRRGSGFQVPASVASLRERDRGDLESFGRDPLDEACGAGSLLATDAWDFKERLWLGGDMLAGAARTVKADHISPWAIAGAVLRGLRTPT